jgi:hypothetical protein
VDRIRRLETAVVALVVLPILVAIGRRFGGDWVPMGDNALIEMRAHDVFSLRHFPFLGTWSSASLTAGTDLNHPGPLLFDVLAVPVRLFGGPAGVAIGVGVINIAAIVLIAVASHRIGGRPLFLVTMVVVAWFTRALGSGMLTDPWNPHAVLLASLAMFVLTWAVASGRLGFAPWLIAAASLCLQTHLGYAFVVPTCLALATGGAVWSTRSMEADVRRRHRVVALGGSVVTGLVLWWQPIVEQLFGDGTGNLSRILGSTGGDGATTGPGLAARLVAAVVGGPTWARRGAFTEAIPSTPYGPDGRTVDPSGLAGPAVAVVTLLVVIGLLVFVFVLARRRCRACDPELAAPSLVGPVVALVLLVVAIGSLSISPLGPLGLTPHQMRWLWSLSAFVSIVLAWGAVEALRPHVASRSQVRPQLVSGIAVAVAAIGVVANLPAFIQPAGPETAQELVAPSVELAGRLDVALGEASIEGPTLVRTDNLRFAEPYSTVTMAALRRADVDFRVDAPGWIRQLGNARAAGNDTTRTIEVWEGREALEPRDGMELLVRVSPLDASSVEALRRGEVSMAVWFATNPLELTDEGARDLAEGRYGLTADELDDAVADPSVFVAGGLAAALVRGGAVVLPDDVAADFAATATLRDEVGLDTVAVFVTLG